MGFDHSIPHIVNKPGGVILHHNDGVSETYAYGQQVPTQELADYQLENLHRFTDQQARSEYVQTPAVEQEAHRQAAFADGSQINSTSDPVPSNYSELSEEDAAQLVIATQNSPEIQARLLLHERVHHGGRRMVIDAGTEVAKAIAETLFGHAENGVTHFAQTGQPVVDQEREVERAARASAAARSQQAAASAASSQQASPAAPVAAASGQTPAPQSQT